MIKDNADGTNAAKYADTFEQIAREYSNYIYAVCVSITKNDQDAFDASQEALVNIYINLRSFQNKSKLSTWIYSISKNAALDILRQKNRNVLLTKILKRECETEHYCPSVADISLFELRNELTSLINMLPSDQKSVIILRDIEGKTYIEISKILNINICTMKTRLLRARKKIREGILPYLEIQ